MKVQIVQSTAHQKFHKGKGDMIQKPLKEWAAKERIMRGWSIRQMAERMGKPHSTIRRVFNDDDRVGVETCVQLAKIFNKPADVVLEMGGWIPRRPEETKLSRELMHIFAQMPASKQYDLIDYARFILDK